jgi:hypothetical protein
MPAFPDRNWGCRIREYQFRGLRMVVLENELLRIAVLVDKGTDIYELLYKPLDIDLIWRSPFPLRNPALFVPTVANANGAFHDNYHGGWQEILPTGGIPVSYKGAEFGWHGEISLIPWDYAIVTDSPDRIVVKFNTRTYRTPFFVEKTLRLDSGQPVLMIEEQVINEGEEILDMMWGHHPTLGSNFIDESCQIDLPGAKVMVQDMGDAGRLKPGDGYTWPMVPGVQGDMIDLRLIPPRSVKSHDNAFFYDLHGCWFAIRNTEKKLGFGMQWSHEVIQCLWYWQVFGGAYGYNLYGRSYHLALEPWSSYPGSLDKAIANGTSIKINPGEKINNRLLAVVFNCGASPVQEIRETGNVRFN